MRKMELKAYRDSSLQHATGGALVVACFREARRALAEARKQIEAGTAASSYTALEKVRRIYTHLYSTLDLQAGGELAVQMQRLYAFVIEQTMLVASSYDLDALAALEKITDDMRDAWQELAVTAPPPQAAARGTIRAQG